MYHLNLYENIISPTVNNSITIEEWFNLIKQSNYSNSILAARPFGKKHKLYTDVKSALPAVTYNFLFSGKKLNSTITGSTGLLYIDIDTTDFDISSVNKNQLYAYYKSFGGDGYSILVQVSGLTIENYSTTCTSIINHLGLSAHADLQAKKPTQYSVLSYDPDIFINYNSQVFEAVESDKTIVSKPVPATKPFKASDYTSDANTPLRFDNLNEINIMGNYAFNWQGWTYINCWIPMKKIQTGKRNSYLLSYCNNLVWLNPQLTVAGAITIMKNVCNKSCEESVSGSQIKSIVDSIFRYKEAGTLNPIINKKDRKIVFANHSGLNRNEKFAICRELLADKKQNESLEKIDKIISDWDFKLYGKIGQAAIYKNNPISKKTVEKYWNDFKDVIRDLNNKFSTPSIVINKKKKIYTIDGGERIDNNLKDMNEQKAVRTENFSNVEVKEIDDVLYINSDDKLCALVNYNEMKNLISEFDTEELDMMYNYFLDANAGDLSYPLNKFFWLDLNKIIEQGKGLISFNGTYELKQVVNN